MVDSVYRWYPVYTKSRSEKKAYAELTKKGIEAYLPLRISVKQWSDRKKKVEEPLIKSYVFAFLSAKEFAEVLMTPGVARFIYFSGHVASIPDQQIADLKLLLATEAELELFDFDIAAGEKVLVHAGPFKGMIAELVSVKNKKSIILRLQNLGYAIEIRTSMAFIQPF